MPRVSPREVGRGAHLSSACSSAAASCGACDCIDWRASRVSTCTVVSGVDATADHRGNHARMRGRAGQALADGREGGAHRPCA